MNALAPLNVLGLMSGTSLDGVDAVLARLEHRGDRLLWQVLGRASAAYPAGLRARLLAALKPESSDVALLTQLHSEVAEVYAELASAFKEADLIALSGQTVYHIPREDPARGWQTKSTLQLGEAAIVGERCGLPVMSDFRQSDMAAGGEGAPLVAFGDRQLFSEPGVARAVHNLGGISNLSYLPADGHPDGVFAFDTGPANCLLDEAAAHYFGHGFDAGGALAAQGGVDEAALRSLLGHPYLKRPPPKTTGREVFTLSALGHVLEGLSGHDALATLTAFTAESVALAYRDIVLPNGLDEILVAGGGAYNETLLAMMAARLDVPVRTFEDLGWKSKDREALAFAVMAYYGYYGLPNTLPRATGAKHAVIAGKLTRPYLPNQAFSDARTGAS